MQGLSIHLYQKNSLALAWSEAECISQLSFFSKQIAAARVASLVQAQLRENSLELGDLEYFLVNRGPGSFTGIKIGLAYAQGVRLARPSLKLRGLSGLALLSQENSGNVYLLKATRTQGYCFIDGVTRALALGESGPFFYNPETLVESETEFDWDRIVFAQPWPELASKLSSKKDWPVLSSECLSGQIARGMVSALDQQNIVLADNNLEALYLRKSAPEELLIKKSKN